LTGEERSRKDRPPQNRDGRSSDRRRDDQPGGGRPDDRRSGPRRDDRGGGPRRDNRGGGGGGRRDNRGGGGGGRRDNRGGGGGGRRDDRGGGGGGRRDDRRGGGGGRRDDRRGGGGGRRDDRRGGGGGRRDDRPRVHDDKVDLVPSFESMRRPLGPDGKPIPREIVVPGQTLTSEDMRAGLGAYKVGDEIVSATLGIKNVDGTYASVIPLGGKYIPRVGDIVIGNIEDVGPSNWLIEIASPYPAPMHVNEVPWHVEFGETTDFMKTGDVVIVRIIKVTMVGRVQVTMEGPGLRKLQGGQITTVPHTKVPRVIGTKGSMISLIKKYTGCRLVVGQNGRIWVDGEPDDILIAIGAIQMIAEHAHVHGLTNNVKEFLQKAKGIDPEVEAEEEKKAAEARHIEQEQRRVEQERRRVDQDKKRAEEKQVQAEMAAKEEKQKRELEEEEDFDDEYDSVSDDSLCRDPNSGEGIVTILSPDGESLMVVDEEDIPPCEELDERQVQKKEDN
jgi:exosome complex component RRP4